MSDIEAGSGSTVGERLRQAREAQGINLEDIAARTRIPTRHLESLESSEWSRLPAATYSIGFAKSYASAVGLDRNEIAEQLRAEMGGFSPTSTTQEVYEPADPARVMPKWLVIAAIVAVIAVVAGLWYARERDLAGGDEPTETAATTVSGETGQPVTTGAAAPAAPAAGAPVVLTANESVWLQVTERGGATLFQGELQVGQSYEVPASATAPLLRTGKPEALRISVGTADAPPVGPAATTVRDVSLLGRDLMRAPGATPPAQPAQAPR